MPEIIIAKLTKIILALAAGVIAILAIAGVNRKIGRHLPSQRTKTLVGVLNNIGSVVVLIIVALVILAQLEVNLTPLLASAGIVGLAIGFGSQSLIRDIISGLFFLAEDQIRVGDLVKIGALTGSVEKITLRSLILRDLDGSLHIIPNSQVSTISNLTRDWSQVNLEIGVAARHKVDEVLSVIQKVADQLEENDKIAEKITSKPEILGIEQITGGKMVVKVLIKTKPKKQFGLARQFNYLIKKAFEEADFEFA